MLRTSKNNYLLNALSVPSDNDISTKEFNTKSKWKDQEIEIDKMRQLKTTTVPVIVRELGMIKKRTDEGINKIPSSPIKNEI